MKYALPLLCMIFFSSLSAQTYFPLIDATSEWRDEIGTGGDGVMNHVVLEKLSIGTDTFFNSHVYYKITGTIQHVECNWQGLPGGGACAWEAEPPITYPDHYYLREDSLKRVYISTPSYEELLYDFDLHEGDTLPLSFINPEPNNYVLSIDSVLVGAQYRKRLNIGNPAGWTEDPFASIIEGVGSTYGLLNPLYVPFEFYYQLICFTNNGETTQFAEQVSYVEAQDDNAEDCDLIYVDIFAADQDLSNLSVTPNPVQNKFSLTLPGFNDKGILKLISVSNEIVLHKDVVFSSGSSIEESIAHLPSGIYCVLFCTETIMFSVKIIKQ